MISNFYNESRLKMVFLIISNIIIYNRSILHLSIHQIIKKTFYNPRPTLTPPPKSAPTILFATSHAKRENHSPARKRLSHIFFLSKRSLTLSFDVKTYSVPSACTPGFGFFALLMCVPPPTYHPLDYALLKMLIWLEQRCVCVCVSV